MVASRKLQKTSKRSTRHVSAAAGLDLPRCIYEFGHFRLNEKERLLFREGKPVPLTPKVFDLLLLLVKRSNSLVEKETILSEIWPDAFVEEANLSVNVATLRKALCEGINEPQYIETVPKRGYRFLARVRKRKAESDRSEAAAQSSIHISPQPGRPAQSLEGLNSLAVLPFQNGSNDPNAEYLSDGITESIINNLSQLRGLRVVARNSVFRYKQTKLTPASLARHLDVHLIVSGRILQLGDRVI